MVDTAVHILRSVWPLLTAALGLGLSLAASVHAVLYKRDSRAAVAWVGLCWLAPFVGPVLYVLLGINRIRRKVAGMRGTELNHLTSLSTLACSLEELEAFIPKDRVNLVEMARLTGMLTQLHLLKGNSVEPLKDGDEAYPAMLEAITQAKKSVTLTVYIFSNDSLGHRFEDALAEASARGVAVRVLIDAAGARYSMPPITYRLRKRGVRTATFMSGLLPSSSPYLNLRNHRKIMVVDGVLGFTGGMNIRANHIIEGNTTHPTHDMHFRVRGPIVTELQAAFVEDWVFTTGENLFGDPWFSVPDYTDGSLCCRVIPDGPDQDLDKMSMAFQGALSVAEESVRIMTPYFLPDRSLISALNTCALRGVHVDIVLPSENNLRLVAWAAAAQLWQVLEWGCNVWMSPPPFDHTKLLVVDGAYSLVGSSNWDPRSLRLNFELGMECYGTELAERLDSHIRSVIDRSRPVRLDEVDGRPLPVKVRDGIARLLAPYL